MFARALLMTSAIALASTAFAQPAAPAASAAPAMEHNCVAHHDHGAEKGMPTPSDCVSPMNAATAASAASAPAKKKIKRHDHAKFHKNQ